MDLPVMIHPLIRREIKVLHIEPTDVCQLACPLCDRETDVEFNKKQQHHLTVEQILKNFSKENIKQLDKMFMCGNYGDPAGGRHTLEIYDYFRSINPTVTLGMNSNGGIRSQQWWTQLAKRLNQPQDYVVFSIDGLKDTNHIYRVNSDWDRVMANAQTFITAGGSAHWDMLVYGHNQHQVDAAEQLARDMGFTWFRAKVSKRPFINQLEFPIGWQKSNQNTGPIQCHALEDRSIYIDAQGRTSPCCWLGGRQSNFIIDFDAVQKSWNTTDPNPVCQKTCSTDSNKTNFNAQWQRETQLC